MPLKYPAAHKENIEQNYHGHTIQDPYRWLEDPNSDETQEFIEAQNALTQAYLSDVPGQRDIRKKLESLLDFPRYSTPRKIGKRYFFSKNEGLQDQPVLYVQQGDSNPEPLIDPNTWSKEGVIALINQSYNKDGSLLAYSTARHGSDRQVIKVRDVDSKNDLPDTIQWCRFTLAAWLPDSTGFFYNRYPEPGTVPQEDESNYSQVYFHTLGTPQEEDQLVYDDPDNKLLGFLPLIPDQAQHLFLYVFQGTDRRNGLYVRRLDHEGGIASRSFTQLLPHNEALYAPLGTIDHTLYVHTDRDAPRGKVIAIDLNQPQEENWQEIIPEKEDAIDQVNMVNQQFMVTYKHHAHHQLVLYTLDGTMEKTLSLPDKGSIVEFSGRQQDTEMLLTFTSFLYPPTILHYDFKADGGVSPYHPVDLPFDTTPYQTTQVFYPSKDGTQIPMFLIHHKGLKQNRKNATILYGYGGFNLAQTPQFTLARIAWLESGGVFALANIRGGDEYGEAWHQAGMLENKQNVLDDFIAAAEWLIKNEYTSTPFLAIEGRSNGGLLTAACAVQRPDLYGAVLSHVGVLDMLRYHKFTVGRYWIPEYGNADENPAQFDFLYAYSPLHNIKPGETYPPMLLTTADTDDRVVPMHSLKFTATMQALASKENPVLLRVETAAGHKLGKPTTKIIDELTDIFSFLVKTIGP